MLFDDPSLHSSAEAVWDGRVWLLLTSALEPQGPHPLLQLAGAAVLSGVLIARAGARTWACAALAGHVLSAVVVYALMGLAGASAAAAAAPDYGISCVVGGTVGGLLASARDSRLALAAGVLGAVALIPGTHGWYGLEHPLSIVFGAAAAWPLVRS